VAKYREYRNNLIEIETFFDRRPFAKGPPGEGAAAPKLSAQTPALETPPPAVETLP
jgi:hypothetical protein